VRSFSVFVAVLMLCGGCRLFKASPSPSPSLDLKPCLTEQPPKELEIWISGPEAGCPSMFAWCITPSNSNGLERNLRELRRYAAMAWLQCGDGKTETTAKVEVPPTNMSTDELP
jgi:hypothetical protein